MLNRILAEATTSISEFKKNPMAAIQQGKGNSIAVLSHNQPAFYCVPAKSYELLMDRLDDMELVAIVKERENQQEVEIDINDL